MEPANDDPLITDPNNEEHAEAPTPRSHAELGARAEAFLIEYSEWAAKLGLNVTAKVRRWRESLPSALRPSWPKVLAFFVGGIALAVLLAFLERLGVGPNSLSSIPFASPSDSAAAPRCSDYASPTVGVCTYLDVVRGGERHLFPGEVVRLRVIMVARAEPHVDDLTVRVTAPAGFRLLPDSTTLAVASAPTNYLPMSDHLADRGINIGSYMPGATALVLAHFRAPP